MNTKRISISPISDFKQQSVGVCIINLNIRWHPASPTSPKRLASSPGSDFSAWRTSTLHLRTCTYIIIVGSLEVKLPTIWRHEAEKRRVEERKRKKIEKRRYKCAKVRGKKIHAREMLGKSGIALFFQWFAARCRRRNPRQPKQKRKPILIVNGIFWGSKWTAQIFVASPSVAIGPSYDSHQELGQTDGDSPPMLLLWNCCNVSAPWTTRCICPQVGQRPCSVSGLIPCGDSDRALAKRVSLPIQRAIQCAPLDTEVLGTSYLYGIIACLWPL